MANLHGIGSAATRPEEDTVIIATSVEIDQDIRCWEATAAIGWVINGNRKVEPLAIDRATRKEFRLSHRDVAVSLYQPGQFLLKFEHKAHCAEVLSRGRITADGALVQLRAWRPLENAYGAAMSFRIKLCLEGVPAYGHTPFVAERIIARRCSFDRLVSVSTSPASARSLDCWAWTANPSSIPKVVWLTFTSRSNGLRGEVLVNDVCPTGTKRGATFKVIVHLDTMEDFSMAPLDFFGSSCDAGAFKPTPISFEWHYLSIDGMPPLPVDEDEDDEAKARAAALARREQRGPRDDHPRFQHRRRDDHDDDFDRDGARRDRRGVDGRWDGQATARRERTRSPRRRETGGSSHEHRRAAAANEMDIDARASPMVLATKSTPDFVLGDLRALLGEQAKLLKEELLESVTGAIRPVMEEAAVLRGWLERATELLRAVGAPAALRRMDSPPRSPAAVDASPACINSELLTPVAGSQALDARKGESAGLEDAEEEDSTAASLLKRLSITPRIEAWNVDASITPPHGATQLRELVTTQEDDGSEREPLLSSPMATMSKEAPFTAASPGGGDGIGGEVLADEAAEEEASPLQRFLDSIANPVPPPLIPDLPARTAKKTAPLLCSPRRSGRIAIKKKARLLSDGTDAVQELIARVCGILGPEDDFDDDARAAYKNLFMRAPLAPAAIQAMEALVKQVQKLKKKKGPAKSKATPVSTFANV